MMFERGNGPIVRLSATTRWFSYVVLPQPRWSGEKIMAPKTVPSLKAMGVPPVLSREEVIRRMQERRSTNMMVHDAEPGDVYVDEGGKLWRCVRPPTVSFEEVEGTAKMDVSGAWVTHKERCEGDIHHAPMWNGWKRIWRKEKPKADPAFLRATKAIREDIEEQLRKAPPSTGEKAEPVQWVDEKTRQQWQDEYNKANGPLPGWP